MRSTDNPWPCVSLTYDGLLIDHREHVLPNLNRLGLKATFYADPQPLLLNLPDWRNALTQGHEIGNGCLIRSVLPNNRLPAWPAETIAEEIDLARSLIEEALPNQKSHSFGFPWGPSLCADESDYCGIVRPRYPVARSGYAGYNRPTQTRLDCLYCLPMNGITHHEMVDYVRSAKLENCWVILAFAGIGTGEPSVDAAAHDLFVEWLAAHQSEIPVRTVSEQAARLQPLLNPQKPVRLV